MVLLCPNEVLVSFINMSTLCPSDRPRQWTAIPSVGGGYSLPLTWVRQKSQTVGRKEYKELVVGEARTVDGWVKMRTASR